MITELAASITPSSLFTPCPPASCRTAWEDLPKDLKLTLIEQGERYFNYSFEPILATEFMDFSRTGDRDRYQTKLFLRRTILNALVLAECVEYQGRFLDDIINTVFLICEETAWQLPAHNSYIRDTPQLILPDVTRPVLDLFAAETGAVLAVTEYVLRDTFARISPHISIAIEENLEKRIFSPYLNQHFWWMGNGREAVNNWTSWCTQNVLLAAFTGELDAGRQQAVFQKACRSLNYFLEEYGEDGCCDEGAQYYRHAGLTLFNALEVLNGITDDAFSPIWTEPKVRHIAAYILNAHIDGIYYVNFADCSPVAGRCNAREFLFGRRTGNEALMAFAASDYQKSEDPLTLDEHNLFYRLQTVFAHQEMMDFDHETAIMHPDIFYPSVGLFIARDDHFCLAVKGGDNDDSHNHNDTGSFTVYKDGHPMFIDIGVETYTKKTFSPQRYEIWTMQSQYHNLPAFDQLMQEQGACYHAADVNYQLEETFASISMDIAPAYPDASIKSYIRQAVLEKGSGITITDTYTGSRLPAVLSLMTYEEPLLDGELLKIGSLGTCRISGAARIQTECIPITDNRLKQAWKHDVYRTLVTLKDTRLILTIQ